MVFVLVVKPPDNFEKPFILGGGGRFVKHNTSVLKT